ncbi:S9 family peptidase [Chitinophaga oryzae]|uniref:S9 family peptidase n=1 Tax=Chitinophaga oryzae TaxID=2725414 RepID=A0AAE7D7V1_9BACT|nr:prolyl oligopeptidase family serine peptidase [Chitinophaga oryzae]QJB32626.1 S9 family peptidase [Chitinophaga oryzae]
MKFEWNVYIIVFLQLFFSLNISAQKKPIDVGDLGKWSYIPRFSISNNGKYVSYCVYKDRSSVKGTVFIKSLDGQWNIRLEEVFDVQFAEDNTHAVCKYLNGCLGIIELGGSRQDTITSVKSHFLFTVAGDAYLAYTAYRSNVDTFFIHSLNGARYTYYTDVVDVQFVARANIFFLKRKVKEDTYIISKFDVAGDSIVDVFRGKEPFSMVADSKGKQIVFYTVDESDISLKKRLYWYYNCVDGGIAKEMFPRQFIDPDLNISGFNGFGWGDSSVFCSATPKPDSLRAKSLVNVNVWSADDPEIKLREGKNRPDATHCTAIWRLNRNEILQVQKRGESTVPIISNTRYWLLTGAASYSGEWNWNRSALPERVLLDMFTGERKVITTPLDRNASSYILSPSGKVIIYFDAEKGSYFKYDVSSGERSDITRNLLASWTTYDNNDIPYAKFINLGIGGFSKDESKVYLYEKNDIYEIDLTGKTDPVNMTGGYGKINNLVFRFAFPPEEWSSDRVILTAFNRVSKDDGFYELSLKKEKKLKKLTMQDAIFVGPEESKYIHKCMPVKAKDVPVYLVQRMDVNRSPNIYVTTDFQEFKLLSDVFPEKRFNWMRSELVGFKTLDGKELQGVLYKPEDFDSTRKYPVIFYYYEKISECLNYFHYPDLCYGPMDIGYFVSNGYLVFTPDIQFEIGYPGRSSFNAVMGAANRLASFSYIDSTKFGLQGHSFGGFQTNYIITHTNRFAAACSASGFTDYVSAYGSLVGSEGYSRQGQYELFRDRIGNTLWERPDLYIENSPVFKINSVQTPLLMMHNVEDMDVSVSQGVEFFTGLRRLGKVCYLLQYDGEGHSLLSDNAAGDYSSKMKSFFDYYLKGGMLPNWMSGKPMDILNYSVR